MDQAYKTLAAVKGLKLRDADLYQEIRHLNLCFLARQKNWAALEQQLLDKNLFTGKYRPVKIYLEALLNATTGKRETAIRNFEWLASANPFFEVSSH